VDSCARVNNKNIKIGKAKDLARRYLDYVKDFDEANIYFLPLVLTQDIQRAETVVLRALKEHRKRSPKGGLMDWLEGIDISQTAEVALSTLAEEQLQYRNLWKTESMGRSGFDKTKKIRVLEEKVLRNIPSKGRRQWDVLRECDGKTVQDFYDIAKAKTRSSVSETYQSGSWWSAELRWCLDRGYITLES
jgi:hypothetical protein